MKHRLAARVRVDSAQPQVVEVKVQTQVRPQPWLEGRRAATRAPDSLRPSLATKSGEGPPQKPPQSQPAGLGGEDRSGSRLERQREHPLAHWNRGQEAV